MKRLAGFTLLELLVAIGLLGILAALAGPPLAALVDTTRINAAQADLRTALQYARTEAVRRRQTLYVKSANGNWAQGWFVTTDVTDTIADCGVASSCLQVYPGRDVGISNYFGPGYIAINRHGRPPTAHSALLIFCDKAWSASRTIDFFYWHSFYANGDWVTNSNSPCSFFGP